ncbi:MAG: type II toxin-antitoxin system VapB family antitoxin [Chloroflexota bacterium]
MPKTTIDIDPKKATKVKRLLGTQTLRETVDRALDAVIQSDARRRSIERLERMDGLDLDKERVMREAWR